MPVDADQKVVTRWLIPLGVVGLFLIAMLAAVVAGRPMFTPPSTGPEPLPVPSAQQTLPPVIGGEPQQQQGDDTILIVVSTLLLLFLLAVVITALALIVRAVQLYWRERPPRRQYAANADTAGQADIIAEATPDAPIMRRGIEAARAAISGHQDPTDAIIAAWVGLEQTAVDSGVGRGASETPAEFTLRILLRRPVIDTPARELLRLYESVRFGGHTAGETMRDHAAQSLREIEEGWR